MPKSLNRSGEAKILQATPPPNTKLQQFGHFVLSNQSAYRMVPSVERRYVMVGTQSTQVGQTIHGYDPTLRVETTTTRYLDPSGATDPTKRSVTLRTYDMQTGNLQTVTKPNFAGQAGAPVTSFMYNDSQKLFVTQTINELGHRFDSIYDLGTGVGLSSRGPNVKDAVKEGWFRKIDGFGRILEENVYIDAPAGPGYAALLVTQKRYFDFITGGPAELNGHAGVIVERRIEINENRWTRTATQVDGVGRVVATTAFIPTAADPTVPVAVTRYQYDAGGNLSQADLPAPSQPPGTATVRYALSYDPLGRLIRAERPDKTGQQFTYNGRLKTRKDVVGAAGGVVSKTRTQEDAFGRLIQTQEYLGVNWATTQYDYDANDNVRLITSADGIKTEMEHDWISQRVRVTRGGQTWHYGYDLNGNMTNIQTPVPVSLTQLSIPQR